MMRRSWMGCAPLVAGCSASGGTGADYRSLTLPNETFAVPQDVFASDLRRFPEGREGRQEMELSLRKAADGTYAVVLTRTGFLDDSVEGDQQRAVLRYEGGGWRAAELGERWRCRSGRGPASWTTQPCR